LRDWNFYSGQAQSPSYFKLGLRCEEKSVRGVPNDA
jgi:hypothetical protein